MLSIKGLVHLLKPAFSEDGENSLILENSVYGVFIKYVREVAAGKREGLTLESVLQFVTGAQEEPVLGFVLKPSIEFVEAESNLKWSFLPTGNTCINKLRLPRPNRDIALSEEKELFEVYDFAFANAYFGRN